MTKSGIRFFYAYLSLLIGAYTLINPAIAQDIDFGTVVIAGGTLIDGNGGAPIEDALIIIRENRIETVAREGEISLPSSATILNAEGKYILPGLMDAHVHYAAWMPELFLNHGVTSAFSIGSGGHWALAHRRAINEGKIPGPRTFVAIGSIAGGRIAAVSARSGGSGGLSGRQVATDAESARVIARRFIEAGADMIKVHRGPPFEAYQAAIEVTHEAGLPVVAQPLGPTVYGREAVLAGADILEHAAGVSYSIAANPSKWEGWGEVERHSVDPLPYADMDEAKAEEMVQLLVDNNVYLEPDLIAMGRGFHKNRDRFELQDYRLLRQHGLSYIAERERLTMLDRYHDYDEVEPAEFDLRNKAYQNMLRFMRMYAEAGGKLLAGTDTAGWAVPGIGLLHEMEIMEEEVGLTPMQTIQAATRNSAEAFRVLEQLGTIEAGKLADVLIVNKDPLQTIRNLHDVAWVIKDGKVVDRTYHASFNNPMPRGAVEGSAWVRALKRQNMQGVFFGQPPPGIEAISPIVITEGDPDLTLKVTGINFTRESLVYFGEQPVTTRLVSETEIEAIIDAALINTVGTYPVTVRNPEPLQRPEWGDGTSNKAYLIVDYRY